MGGVVYPEALPYNEYIKFWFQGKRATVSQFLRFIKNCNLDFMIYWKRCTGIVRLDLREDKKGG